MKNTFAVKASLFTLILALIAIGTFAITEVMGTKSVKTLQQKVVNQTWHYTGGTNPAEFNMPQNWSLGSTPLSCDAVQEVPCELNDVPAEDRDQLEEILLDYPNDEIFNIATARSAQ